jgi:hypothetical protein
LILWKANGDKDIYNIKCHIDSNSGTDHRWKGIGPKASVDRGDSKEKGSDYPSYTGNKYEDSTRKEMEDEATDTGYDTFIYGHRGELGNDLKGGTIYYILYTEQIL